MTIEAEIRKSVLEPFRKAYIRRRLNDGSGDYDFQMPTATDIKNGMGSSVANDDSFDLCWAVAHKLFI